jgi:hypothetical protein
MDQAQYEQLLADFKTQVSQESTIYDMETFAGKPDGPIVVMVHGIGGHAKHWSDPVSLNVNDTWLFDLNAKPQNAGNGLLSSPPYNPQSVSSWTQYFRNNNVSYVNFSQAKPGDLIQYAVVELVSILRGLETRVFPVLEQDATSNNSTVPSLIILCHSRGGLVTRNALKQLGAAGVPHLRKVITLFTPHRGSYMPKLADDYNNGLHNQVDFNKLSDHVPGFFQGFVNTQIEPILNSLANKVREAMLHSFGTLAQSPGFDELIPTSSMLQSLAQDEQPIPGVLYYSFGGANPTFVDFFASFAGQTIRLLATASPVLVELLANIPGVRDNYGGLAEIDKGDSAVAMSSSTWPEAFSAQHQVYHLNHMQALVDKSLQETVLGIVQEGKVSSW